MIRLAMQVERERDNLVTLALFVNGSKVSGACGITIRSSEFADFVRHINPDGIRIDAEMVSAHLVEQVRGYKNAQVH